jgi:ankyrin repeat protein
MNACAESCGRISATQEYIMTKHRGLIVACLVSVAAFVVISAQVPSPAPPAQTDADRFFDAIRGDDLAKVRSLLDGGADVNVVERRGGATPLMNAAAVGSLDVMRLLIDRKANVNAKSYAGATALMWAVADLAKVRLLVDRGADVNVASSTGRTALELAAMGGDSAAVVRLLLQHGANPRAVDAGNVTTVLAATIGNDTESIRLLVEAGGDVNAAVAGDDVGDFTGATPLMNAAEAGNVEAVRLLLSKGAKVNVVSGPPNAKVKNGTIAIGTLTPLLLASTYGPDALVRLLLAAGADVNVKDARGMTPLMLSVSADHGDPAVTKSLLTAGAKVDHQSLAGESAMDWAIKSGPTPRVVALKMAGGVATGASGVHALSAVARAPSVRAAVERGAALIQPATGKFFVNGGCASCHAQNITDIAVAEVRAAGLPVDEAAAAERDAGATAQFTSIATRLLERMDAPVIDIPLYTLAALAAAKHAPDRATDALLYNVAAQQAASGAWHRGGIARPPLSDGDTSMTALGVRALTTFAPPGRRTEMNERVRRALDVLRAVKPITAEDRAFRMLGLVWGGVRPGDLSGYVKEARVAQHPDGGWSQNATLDSDAYSTSIMLYAFIKSGVAASDPSVTRAVNYLLGSQHADGSWYVRSRAPKFQPYFDGGFPYEHDQWISSMATGWATAALASTLRAEASRQASR